MCCPFLKKVSMNAKRVKRIRKMMAGSGTDWKQVEYETLTCLGKTVELKTNCGRNRYRNVKRVYHKFGNQKGVVYVS